MITTLATTQTSPPSLTTSKGYTMTTKAKYIVCPVCEGEGYLSAIGSFTSADVDEWYGDDHEERDAFTREYNRRGGAYDKPCELCKGKRVVTAEQLSAWDDILAMRAEQAAEQRMGC